MIKSVQSIRVPKTCVVQTPCVLADAMVKGLGTKDTDTWLEPCVGNGALLNALSSSGIKKTKIFGLDVDARPRPNDKFGRISRGKEFLRWSCTTRLRFDKIIANPPYVAIEKLNSAIRAAALDVSLSQEIKITSNGNAWYAFLCAAIRLLKKDGSLCFLLPAAWDFANYAAPLRASILKYFGEVRVYRTASPIFRAQGVQEGAIVLIAKGRRDPKSDHENKGFLYRHELPSIKELVLALSSQRQNGKRINAIAAPAVRKIRQAQALGDVLKIGLGVVTGDSSYFLLTDERRRELKLPMGAVTPVLSRAKHLTASNMTLAQWNSLKEDGERVWLFNPKPNVASNRFIRSYLRFGQNGGCEIENHKVAVRTPWFRFPTIAVCDGFMSGMSSSMPWLSFRDMPNLAATNTLYVVNFIDPLLSKKRRLGVALSLLTSNVRGQMRLKGRTYADGLLKYEPSDLMALNVHAAPEIVGGWAEYRRAVRALNEGNEEESRKIADGCLI